MQRPLPSQRLAHAAPARNREAGKDNNAPRETEGGIRQAMKIQFYRTLLCPRCLLVGLVLHRLQASFPDLVVEPIEITTSPLRAWQAGIRMVPALKRGDALLSGFVLTPRQVRKFIEEQAQKGDNGQGNPTGEAHLAPP